MIDIVRIGEQTKRQLINIKRRTGIENWNTICRWGFCISLLQPGPITREKTGSRSNVEMTWKTFAGPNESLYFALLSQERENRVMSGEQCEIEELLDFHIQRGVSILNSDGGNSAASLLFERVSALQPAA
jgi:DNA sulfur modification protein DndE